MKEENGSFKIDGCYTILAPKVHRRCPVCCEYFSHDCDMFLCETKNGERFFVCDGPGCSFWCDFIYPEKLSPEQVKELTKRRIEYLEQQEISRKGEFKERR